MTPLGWEHISLTGDYIWADATNCVSRAVFQLGSAALRGKAAQCSSAYHHLRDSFLMRSCARAARAAA